MKRIVILLLALTALHGSTGWAPMPVNDEAAFADAARHGRLTLFDDVVPQELSIVRQAYGFGVMPGYLALLREQFRVTGVGVWQVRALSIAAGLLGLCLLALYLGPLLGRSSRVGRCCVLFRERRTSPGEWSGFAYSRRCTTNVSVTSASSGNEATRVDAEPPVRRIAGPSEPGAAVGGTSVKLGVA